MKVDRQQLVTIFCDDGMLIRANYSHCNLVEHNPLCSKPVIAFCGFAIQLYKILQHPPRIAREVYLKCDNVKTI